jgi:hypothetical protein
MSDNAKTPPPDSVTQALSQITAPAWQVAVLREVMEKDPYADARTLRRFAPISAEDRAAIRALMPDMQAAPVCSEPEAM